MEEFLQSFFESFELNGMLWNVVGFIASFIFYKLTGKVIHFFKPQSTEAKIKKLEKKGQKQVAKTKETYQEIEKLKGVNNNA